MSKWEGAQSVPDMDKVVQMSRLFGVTTDFLLKDELSEEEPAPEGCNSPLHRVTMAEASEYLALRRAAAPKIAFATMLCILSPICLILLAGMSDVPRFGISEDAAAGVGLCVLLVMVAVGVAIFLACAAKAKPYEFLEKEPFETEYGVAGMVRERQKEHAPAYARLNITGTVLCILAAVPLFAAMCVSASDLFYIGAVCLLLVVVSVGCFAFVLGGVNHSAMQALLEEEDYTRENKAKSPRRRRGQRHLLAARHCRLPLLHLRPHGQRTAEIQLVHLGGRGRALRRGHAGGKAHRKEKVTAARYIKNVRSPRGRTFFAFSPTGIRHSRRGCRTRPAGWSP